MNLWSTMTGFFLFTLFTSSAVADGTLESKLQAQWAKYGEARQRLLERLSLASPAPVSREEWESWLKVDDWGAADKEALRADQRRRIEEARWQAIQESRLDISPLRYPGWQGQDLVRRFCADMPKGGMLHIHPSGTLARATGRRLLEAKNPVLSVQGMLKELRDPSRHYMLYPDEWQWLAGLEAQPHYAQLSLPDRQRYLDFLTLPPGSHPFERFDSVFVFVDSVVQDWDDEAVMYLDFARRAVAQGVSYVELRTGVTRASLPRLAPILQRMEMETGLTVRVDRSFNRTSSEEERQQALADLLAMPSNRWVIGIDFLGNERLTPALETGQFVYGRLLQAVIDGRSHLRRTMHAGEIGDPRDPRDAIIMGVERLGHGVLLADDPVTLEYAARQRIPVEVNLISNLRLQAVTDMAHHPFLDFLRLGIPVSLSTDDEGIFETDINKECRTAITQSDVSYAELRQMAFNAITTSFMSEDDKARVLAQLTERFTAFEQRWSALARLPEAAASGG